MKDRDFRQSTNVEDRQDQMPPTWTELRDARPADLSATDEIPPRNVLSDRAGAVDLDRRLAASKGKPSKPAAASAPQRFADVGATDPKAAIVRAATEAGEDPAFALAVADRESRFNPAARASKSIAGLYQMRGDLRQQYGAGDSTDPYDQAKAWMPFIGDVKGQMAAKLGRTPTDPEAYLGHYYGAARAARTLTMDPATPTDQVFTANELAQNPEFAKAGTIGALNSSVMADISKRQAKFAGTSPAASGAESASGTSPSAPDYSRFAVQDGDPAGQGQEPVDVAASAPELARPVVSGSNAAGTIPTLPDYTAQSEAIT